MYTSTHPLLPSAPALHVCTPHYRPQSAHHRPPTPPLQVGALEKSLQPSAVDPVLTGLEFDDLPAVEKAEAVSMMSVFARVEPSHKSRLVELLKAQVGPCLTEYLTYAADHT